MKIRSVPWKMRMKCVNIEAFLCSVLKKCNVNNSLLFIFKWLSLKEVNVLNTHQPVALLNLLHICVSATWISLKGKWR